MLNEPEASPHPDLIARLARLIGAALVEALHVLPGARRFTLERRLGETAVG